MIFFILAPHLYYNVFWLKNKCVCFTNCNKRLIYLVTSVDDSILYSVMIAEVEESVIVYMYIIMYPIPLQVNIIPVIAKADTISKSELHKFKIKIMSELVSNGVQIYQFPLDDETVAKVNTTMNVRKHTLWVLSQSRDMLERRHLNYIIYRFDNNWIFRVKQWCICNTFVVCLCGFFSPQSDRLTLYSHRLTVVLFSFFCSISKVLKILQTCRLCVLLCEGSYWGNW